MLRLYRDSRTVYVKFQLPFLIKGTIHSNAYLAFIFQNKKPSPTAASEQTFAKITQVLCLLTAACDFSSVKGNSV